MGSWMSKITQGISWTSGIVALGLGLRLYHYGRNPSLWHDEAALVLNVLDKDFRQLLGPLSFAEAAPPAFLWLEKAVTLLLGDSTYALRLLPLLASCASLLLFVPIAQRLLRPAAVPWAVLLIACSDHLLWHSCEAKPYALDVLAATLLLAVFAWSASWELGWQLLVCGLLGLVLVFLVYPGCFLAGGLLVALLPAVWRAGQRKFWLGYGLAALGIGAGFGLLLIGPIRAQRCATIVSCWQSTFPHWDRPTTVPIWTALAVVEVFRYCFEPMGQVLILGAGFGAVQLWRRGAHAWLALLLVPFLLPLGAAYLHAYPFGGFRVVVFTAPALALLTAEGLAAAVRNLPRSGLALLGRCGAMLLLLLPASAAVRHVVAPWDRADCVGAAAYVWAHYQPADRVTANHWEYAYYFRHLGSAFGFFEEGLRPGPGRLWLVATSSQPADRREMLHFLCAQGWAVQEQQEFPRTSVFLLDHVDGEAERIGATAKTAQ